jgi:hypothetical protein
MFKACGLKIRDERDYLTPGAVPSTFVDEDRIVVLIGRRAEGRKGTRRRKAAGK